MHMKTGRGSWTWGFSVSPRTASGVNVPWNLCLSFWWKRWTPKVLQNHQSWRDVTEPWRPSQAPMRVPDRSSCAFITTKRGNECFSRQYRNVNFPMRASKSLFSRASVPGWWPSAAPIRRWKHSCTRRILSSACETLQSSWCTSMGPDIRSAPLEPQILSSTKHYVQFSLPWQLITQEPFTP